MRYSYRTYGLLLSSFAFVLLAASYLMDTTGVFSDYRSSTGLVGSLVGIVGGGLIIRGWFKSRMGR
jgi:hypothetical protein